MSEKDYHAYLTLLAPSIPAEHQALAVRIWGEALKHERAAIRAIVVENDQHDVGTSNVTCAVLEWLNR